ncbi:MAG: GNAT family N-acetyltransferase [Flavobacteriaceae bacterium]
MNYKVTRYQPEHKQKWDDFINRAKNATFLFHRDFMDYHSERFEDYSLMVFSEEKLVSVLPANLIGNEIYSHQGLSYGGFIFSKKSSLQDCISICQETLKFLLDNGILKLHLKSIPIIYQNQICQELEVLVFFLEAKLTRVDTYFIIDNSSNYTPNRNRKRAITKAILNGLHIKKTNDLKLFWESILSPNLQNRFGVNPTHSLSEIELLMDRFPNNIHFFGAYSQNVLKAGAVIFEMKEVAHFQYSSGDENRDEGAIDLLFDSIIKQYKHKKYVSFGTSSEANGSKINNGLAYWKESFGAGSIVQNFYEIQTSKFKNLTNRFV